ncbi:uncharacterized protein LOC134533779 isoform X2 [Bacillus rossius redtenbacheri]|uniref:uncharacterized protein LOC134533779 isoform X2 n=1 Tax=Bacillus rossius redtenbacheri TaxID=93214 RepID=UPI002FDD82CB
MSSQSSASASASAAQSSKRGADLCKEYDCFEREAELYLFTRPVDQRLPDSVQYHHWALVFHFDGNDVRTVEGFGDEDDNILFAHYTKEKPKDEGKYFALGKVLSSPTKVLEMAKSNDYNYKSYTATWQNCQTWVKWIAEQLGEEVVKKINDFKTLKQANPFVAIAGKKISVGSRQLSSASKSVSKSS